MPESPFECYMSEQILSFTYLMCPSVSGPKALKKRGCDLPYSISVIKQTIFKKIKKELTVRTQIALSEKIFRKKNFADTFLLFMFNLPTVKIWGQLDKFPISISF